MYRAIFVLIALSACSSATPEDEAALAGLNGLTDRQVFSSKSIAQKLAIVCSRYDYRRAASEALWDEKFAPVAKRARAIARGQSLDQLKASDPTLSESELDRSDVFSDINSRPNTGRELFELVSDPQVEKDFEDRHGIARREISRKNACAIADREVSGTTPNGAMLRPK